MKKYKDIDYRCQELKESLDRIKDICEDFMWRDKALNMNYLAGIARMLLERQGRNFHPLLRDIMCELKISPIIYSVPEQINPSTIHHPLYCDMSWGVVPRPGINIPYVLPSWLKVPAYVFSIETGIHRVSRMELIRAIADKHGGAHYDLDISPFYENLTETYIATTHGDKRKQISGVQLFLLDISMAIHYLGYYALHCKEALDKHIPKENYEPLQKLENHYRFLRITNIKPPISFIISPKDEINSTFDVGIRTF